MNKHIIKGVVCPFTKRTHIEAPYGAVWAGSYSDGDKVIYYFRSREAMDEGLITLLSHLMQESDTKKVSFALQKLITSAEIYNLADEEGQYWYFVRLPKQPRVPSIADIILTGDPW